MQLRKYGFSILKIQNIFISHVHGDHLFGIYGLLSTMSMLGRTAPVFIYAPTEFSAILSDFLRHFGGMFKYDISHIPLKGEGLNTIFETKSFEVLSFPLNHRIECYGFLFREKYPRRNVHKYLIEKESLTLKEIARLKDGEDVTRDDGSGEILKNNKYTYLPYKPRSFAYCSDTAPFGALKSYIKGVDLLYHEATFTSDMAEMAKATMHSTASDAAQVAKEACAGKLVIGHYSSRYKELTVLLKEARNIFPDTYLAEEGTEFDIPMKNKENDVYENN
ncbi:MAG: ribonuclease Z [Bacteroidales bacterium]|nr:ribonuclease Z [Bacteroidales bacterium]